MRKRVVPGVLEMFREGRLSPADLMYVSRLKPESQMAAAKKCLRPNPTFALHHQVKSTINHARGRA